MADNLQQAFINALINSAGPVGAVRGLTQPQVDLGRISVQAPPPSIPTPQPTQSSAINIPEIMNPTPDQMMLAQQRGDFVSEQGVKQSTPKKSFNWGLFLKEMAPALVATAAGVASPSMLPGAAGFSQGYGEGLVKTKEREQEQRKLDLAEEKLIADQNEKRQQREEMMAILAGLKSGGNVPVDTKYSKGGLTFNLNPKLSEEERKVITSGPMITDAIDTVSELIDKGASGSNIKKMLIDSGNALWVSGAAEDLQSSLNFIKKSVAFTDAGKALTGPEKAVIFALLNTVGKDSRTIKRDLGRFKEHYQKLEQLVTYGKNAGLSSGDLQQAKNAILKNIKTNVSEKDLDEAYQIEQGETVSMDSIFGGIQ